MTMFRVASQFTDAPGGRYYSDGRFSGEEFREEYLLDLVDEAVKAGQTVTFNFDGVQGMPTSFLEEAFGGMVRARPQYTEQVVAATVRIEAPDTPKLWPYVKFAQDAITRQFKKKQRR